MFWKDVRNHMQNGARLIHTTLLPGGPSVALLYAPRAPAGRATLIEVRAAESLPAWADDEDTDFDIDERPLKAALERVMAAEEERALLKGFVNFPRLTNC